MLPSDLRALIVSVDYHDYLELTLPHQRRFFSKVYVVTSSADKASAEVARRHGAEVLVTDLFFEPGAVFNKWRALEYALDQLGRFGWLCLLDADILWPQSAARYTLQPGRLYTPLRRMLPQVGPQLPPEHRWHRLPLSPNTREWAGYTQIFHADDPVLGEPPWHELHWKHAGCADAHFQAKWPVDRKVRPPWQVLHLGEPRTNWCGRVSRYLDGTRPAQAAAREEQLRYFLTNRRGTGPTRNAHEQY